MTRLPRRASMSVLISASVRGTARKPAGMLTVMSAPWLRLMVRVERSAAKVKPSITPSAPMPIDCGRVRRTSVPSSRGRMSTPLSMRALSSSSSASCSAWVKPSIARMAAPLNSESSMNAVSASRRLDEAPAGARVVLHFLVDERAHLGLVDTASRTPDAPVALLALERERLVDPVAGRRRVARVLAENLSDLPAAVPPERNPEVRVAAVGDDPCRVRGGVGVARGLGIGPGPARERVLRRAEREALEVEVLAVPALEQVLPRRFPVGRGGRGRRRRSRSWRVLQRRR